MIDIGAKGCNKIYKEFQLYSKDVIKEVRLKWKNKSNDDIGLSNVKNALNTRNGIMYIQQISSIQNSSSYGCHQWTTIQNEDIRLR